MYPLLQRRLSPAVRKAVGAFAIILISLRVTSQDHAANSAQILTSAPSVIMSTNDMQDNGVMFGDEPIGFISEDSGGHVIAFSGGGSFSGIDRHGSFPAGTYKFAGTLDHLVPSLGADHRPHYSLTTGLEEPSPDGSDFDRDYAGGGPTYSVLVPDQHKGTTVKHVLLQLYHGEYHYGHPSSMPAYGGTGLAVSSDSGTSFKKLGQILYPHLAREDYLKTNPTGGLWSDAAMVAADSSGRHVSNLSSSIEDYGSIYYYFLFTERNAPEETPNSISIARIKAGELLKAIAERRPPVLHKYFNTTGGANEGKDFFTEPALRGRSTPVITPGRFEFINSPYVIYDSHIRKFILSYQISQKRIVIRTADNLYNWSLPIEVVNLEHDEDQRLFNPSMVALGSDPQLSDGQFYIYYLQRRSEKTGLREPRLMRVKVTLNPRS
jgi:hypothetical protein